MISRSGLLATLLSCFSLAADAGTYVQFRTVWGDIDVELYDEDKPVTVRNFLRYVQSGRYTNMFFHRCPTNQFTGVTDFVLQGGGWYRSSPTEIDRIPIFGTIPNEFGVGRRFSNTYGTIAMAKVGGDTNSASSQFFFNLNNNAFLDAPNSNGYFTVFGRIVGRNSTNVLNFYRGLSLNQGIQNLGGEFETLPVTYFGNRLPTLDDLEYARGSVLNVGVARAGTAREISWNSLNTNVCRVEYTTNLPPVWHTLVTTNGIGRNGEPMRITDAAPNLPRRFYRVRVDF